MRKMIWLDMDGTIANLYKDNWLEELMAKSVKPYAIADRLVEEDVLVNLVKKGYQLGIISWCAKGNDKEYDKMVRIAKRNWLKENYPNVKFSHIHIVKYGYPKQYFKMEENDILVDDEKPNRDNWKNMAIEPKDIYSL